MSRDPWRSASVERALDLHIHGGPTDCGFNLSGLVGPLLWGDHTS